MPRDNNWPDYSFSNYQNAILQHNRSVSPKKAKPEKLLASSPNNRYLEKVEILDKFKHDLRNNPGEAKKDVGNSILNALIDNYRRREQKLNGGKSM